MNNFLEFINKDIEAKKTLISTMPTKTKTNKKKFNETIDDIIERYDEYKTSTRNYLIAKAKSFEVKESTDIDKLTEKLETLENVKFLLNPTNTYVEKMCFDDLLYQINNYDTFNFKSLNEIINGLLDKFEQAGIHLESDDFNYTCYVHEYMTAFLEVRNRRLKSYDKVSEIFEQIYWVNPELIQHIELNFRKLIKKNSRKLNNYILTIQKEVMEKNKIRDYAHCLEKLQDAYIDLNLASKETISDIIAMAKTKELDIEQYLSDSKGRKMAFDSLIPEVTDVDKVAPALEKLKLNILEYQNYLEFYPMFKYFKDEYEKLLTTEKKDYKGLKTIIDQIETKENELEKLNKKIFSGKPGLFEFRSDSALKQLKLQSVLKAKELYELYKTYDVEYFKDKVMMILNDTLTISDVLNLYYSFDYFKKLTIQKVYNITDYDEIIKYSDNFDLFAMNPTNIIITGVPIFSSNNIAKTISNKYRLNSINISEDDLNEDNLKNLLNKILLILRVNKIEKSETTIEKIWFIVQVEKIVAKEIKEND